MDSSIRVLHVDDSPDFLDITVTVLERLDERFTVETATSAEAGLDRLDDDIDCIVSDYEMPGQTGIEFLERVRSRYPDLPFILFTGKGSEAIASDAISAGATDYLQKETTTEQYELLANRLTNAVSQARAEQARRQLLELAETTEHVLYVFTHDWSELLFINSAYEDIWQSSRAQLEENATAFLDGVHPDDRDCVREAMAEVSAGETAEVEFRVTVGKDRLRWVRGHGEPIVNESGTVVRVAGFVTDITATKQRQRELERSRNLLAHTEQLADTGGWEVDNRTGRLRWTDGTYAIHDLSPDGAFDPTVDGAIEFYHPDDRGEIRRLVRRCVTEGEPFDTELRLITADGQQRWVRSTGEAVCEDGEIVRIQGAIRDITEQKTRQQELEQNNDRLDSFASIVSHDLQNPLNVAAIRLELAREERDSEHLDTAAAAIERSQALVDNLLVLSRNDKQVAEPEPVALADIAEDCWQTVETGESTLAVDTRRTVRADRSRLRQLLENLVANAVEHGSTSPDSHVPQDAAEHGSTSPDSHVPQDAVTVTVGDLDDGFYVADDGTGIPEADREELFRAESLSTGTSSGFGLAIVQEVVAAHGWDISVGESDEGGARFEITGVEFVE